MLAATTLTLPKLVRQEPCTTTVPGLVSSHVCSAASTRLILYRNSLSYASPPVPMFWQEKNSMPNSTRKPVLISDYRFDPRHCGQLEVRGTA